VTCLIREALDAIAAEWHENGRGAAFDDLRPFLDGHGDLAELARYRRQNEATSAPKSIVYAAPSGISSKRKSPQPFRAPKMVPTS